MKVVVDGVVLRRGSFELSLSGTFTEGVHLVTGPVGSGKSTLALALAGALRPFAGEIAPEGITARTLTLPFPEYQVTGETLAGEASFWGLEPGPVLAEAGLAGRGGEDPLRCSQGELKRLVLACALGRDWDLLVLDEPYGSLDCTWKTVLSRRLGERRRGITVILTHEDELLPRVDALWEIQRGRLLPRGKVPWSIPRWTGAPAYLRTALEQGIMPMNITVADAREALCRTRG